MPSFLLHNYIFYFCMELKCMMVYYSNITMYNPYIKYYIIFCGQSCWMLETNFLLEHLVSFLDLFLNLIVLLHSRVILLPPQPCLWHEFLCCTFYCLYFPKFSVLGIWCNLSRRYLLGCPPFNNRILIIKKRLRVELEKGSRSGVILLLGQILCENFKLSLFGTEN